jgi:hypothetical protein
LSGVNRLAVISSAGSWQKQTQQVLVAELVEEIIAGGVVVMESGTSVAGRWLQ